MSNSERIARAAAEAEARILERAARPPVTRTRKPREPQPPPRRKIVWAVGVPGAQPVATFAYPDRAAADAEAARLGSGHIVKALKVPMD